MIYQFRLASDDTLWVINTADLTWGKASEILASPSVAAVEARLARFNFSESGELIPMGGGAYNMSGRTAKDGLCTVGILAVPYDTYLCLYLKANVPVKDNSFQSNFPEEAQKFIKHTILKAEAEKKPNISIAS